MSREQYVYEAAQTDPENGEWEGQEEGREEEQEERQEEGQEEVLGSDPLLEKTIDITAEKQIWTRDRVYWMLVQPLPSFTHRLFIKVERKEKTRRSTDWLDGVRGVASLFVFFDHYLSQPFEGFTQYGFGEGHHWSILQLPFIRVFFAGATMVAIFFVISGYVLSRRCVVAMRNGDNSKLGSSLASLAFRRGMRLFLPSIAISFLCYLAVLFGLIRPENTGHPWSVWRETLNYIEYVNVDLFKLWTWDTSTKGWYAGQLWTIPLEFRCSMVLFCIILIVARCRVPIRFSIEAVFLVYLFYVDRWDVALFVGGMVIAELNVIYEERAEYNQSLDATAYSRWRVCRIITPARIGLWLTLFVGYYLAGYPPGDAVHTPGYDFLSKMWHGDAKLRERFWLAQSALLIIFSISFLPAAQAFFSTRVARYLGKTSYSLYLVHDLMNRTIRIWLWQTFWKVLHFDGGRGEEIKFEGGWLVGTIIYIPLVLWVADIFSRAVDEPIVIFTKWVEDQCFEQ